jgi:hypothetical protein
MVRGFWAKLQWRQMLAWCQQSQHDNNLWLMVFAVPAGLVLGQLWAVPDSRSHEALSAQPQQLH